MHKLRYGTFERHRRDMNERKRRSRSRSPPNHDISRRNRRSKSPLRRHRQNDRNFSGERSNTSKFRRSLSRGRERTSRDRTYPTNEPAPPGTSKFRRSLSREQNRRSRDRIYSPHGDAFRRSVSRERNRRGREEMYQSKEQLFDNSAPLLTVSTAYYKETRIEPVHVEHPQDNFYHKSNMQNYVEDPQPYTDKEDTYKAYSYPGQNSHNRTDYYENISEQNFTNSANNFNQEQHTLRRPDGSAETVPIPPPPPSIHHQSNECQSHFPPENISLRNHPIMDFQSNRSQDHYLCSTDNNHEGEAITSPPFEWFSNETETILTNNENLDIPIFNGKDSELTARQWMENIESIGLQKKWNGPDKKLQMAARLEGPARDWFLSQDSINFNWLKIKALFLKQFAGDIEFHGKLTDMLSRTKVKSETYSVYFAEKINLMDKCGIADQKAVSCLIGGIKNEVLKKACFSKNFKTAGDLFEFLVGQDKSSKKPEQNYTPFFQNNVEHLRTNKHCIDVFINGIKLEAFNCNLSAQTTIRLKEAQLLKIPLKEKQFSITGYKGVSMSVLGTFRALLKLPDVSVNTRVFVVPDNFQNFPLILGESLRTNNKLVFSQDEHGIYFSKNPIPPPTRKDTPLQKSNFNGPNSRKF